METNDLTINEISYLKKKLESILIKTIKRSISILPLKVSQKAIQSKVVKKQIELPNNNQIIGKIQDKFKISNAMSETRTHNVESTVQINKRADEQTTDQSNKRKIDKDTNAIKKRDGYYDIRARRSKKKRKR
jgi:hypothetical protein